MYMLGLLCGVVGASKVSANQLMELTNNDVSGAISLICFVIRCPECPWDLQDAAGRCLVQLTTADSVFYQEDKVNEDYNSKDIAKLTAMLNKHVNGLIQSVS